MVGVGTTAAPVQHARKSHGMAAVACTFESSEACEQALNRFQAARSQIADLRTTVSRQPLLYLFHDQ
jgi:hypothetical protein